MKAKVKPAVSDEISTEDDGAGRVMGDNLPWNTGWTELPDAQILPKSTLSPRGEQQWCPFHRRFRVLSYLFVVATWARMALRIASLALGVLVWPAATSVWICLGPGIALYAA
jgi:hypothetical protein